LPRCSPGRSHPVIEELEVRIGKPVVTSTQATLSRLPRLAGVDTLIDDFGRLMQEFLGCA
jgi:maleate isomerase